MLSGFELYSRWVLLLVQLNSIHLYGKTNQQTNKQFFFLVRGALKVVGRDQVDKRWVLRKWNRRVGFKK